MSKTVYTITAPDLNLPKTGPIFTILGKTINDTIEFLELFENLFIDVEITTYVGENPLDDNTVAWYLAATQMSNCIVACIDSMNMPELFLAMKAQEIGTTVLWYKENNKHHALSSLINNQQYVIIDSIRQVEAVLAAEYGSEL
jgi:hypothetical protein